MNDPLYEFTARLMFNLWLFDVGQAWLDGDVEILNDVEVIHE